MKCAEMLRILSEAFPTPPDKVMISDEFIVMNRDLMWIKMKFDTMLYVPAYMNWCVRNRDNYDQLVTHNTLNALATYGRTKNSGSGYSSFKLGCNEQQKLAVLSFYRWCLENVSFINKEQIERSMKQWNASL
jgi:hypothetical protein